MKKFLKSLIIVSFVLSIIGVVNTEQASAHVVNGCPDLKKLVSAEAITFEKSGGSVVWNKVHPDLINAKNKYEAEIKKKGWTITYNSAYRSQEYQEHLAQVVQKANSGSACAKKEKAYHGLTGLVATGVSNHTRGLAFDATIKRGNKVLNSNGYIDPALVTVAKNAGLKFPHVSNDAVHHELINLPSTSVVNNTLYTFNASAKVAKKTKAYKAASTTGGNYGDYSVGNALTIVGVQGAYYKVKYKTTYAFVAQGDVTVTVTETSKTGTATITSSNGFNVRQYPFDTAKQLATVANKGKVTLLAVSGDWYKVKVGNTTGYIKAVKSGLTIDVPVVPTYTFNATGTVTKTTPAYKAANTKSGSFGNFVKGNKVTIVGVQGNYYKIKYKTSYAYVDINAVTAVVQETAKTGTATISATSGFKVLQYPYDTAKSLTTIANKGKVTLLAVSGDWYKVKVGSTTGYIKAVKSGLTIEVKSEYPKTGYVNTQKDPLVVRKTTSTSAASLGSVAKGASITVTGKSGDWYIIKYNNQTGYVSATYVTFTKPTPKVSEYPKTGYVNTNSTSLNVRSAANVTASILGTVNKNASLTVTGKNGVWYSVNFNNKVGWVSADYIVFDKTKLIYNTGAYTGTNIKAALPKSKQLKASVNTFNKYLPTLGLIEGGYVNNPKDKGGETNLGVTATLYNAYYKGKSIKTITHAQANRIFYDEFWQKQAGFYLGKGIAINERLAVVLFDTAVNMNNVYATKALQNAMGLTGKNIDGIAGTTTINKLKTYSLAQQDALALKVLQVRGTYRPSQQEFAQGWTNRDKKLYEDLKQY